MKEKRRNPIARRQRLCRELAVRGAVSVTDLCELFDASPATIRRDLIGLERQGLLKRSYGGAAVRSVRPVEEAFANREQEDIEAKRVIAKAALGLIRSGDTLFLNDGSTVMALAREIAASNLELFVATPAVNVASVLVESGHIDVCLLGGFVRQTSLATSGPFAEMMVDQINPDLTLASCDAFGLEEGIAFDHPDDAALSRKMIAKARRSAALVTGAKLSRSARITALPVTAVNVLVTDQIDATLKTEFISQGLEVIEAGYPPARRARSA